MASWTVRIFSASSSGISSSKASSKAMTNSTVSSESAPRSSTNEALGVTSASSTPSCSTMICFTFSSTAAMFLLKYTISALTDAWSPSKGRSKSWLLLGLSVLVNIVNGVLHGTDFLGVFVGDFDIEGLFESHDQFDGIKGIGAKIVHERGARCNFRFIHAELLTDDLLHFLGCLRFCIRHIGPFQLQGNK